MGMEIPHELLDAVEDAATVCIASAVRTGGGDINEAAILDTDAGHRLFLKWNRSPPDGMFEAEADGLAALGAAAGADLVVPEVIARGTAAHDGGRDASAWLLMEHIGPRAGSGGDDGTGDRPPERDAGWAVRLGRGLAELHRTGSTEFGWHRDNFIGRLPQRNQPDEDWVAFWRDRRMAPQLRSAVDAGLVGGAARTDLDHLVERMDEALAGAATEGPSLLHGDLWNGNAMSVGDGRAAIYDPAVYHGHREVDLAMTELFGFPSDFMPAYREAWPVDELYDARRRDLYQLYYLLVHVNLFGRSYLAGSVTAARRVLATL